MVIETYTHGPGPVYARAAERGRMLPPGLEYVESWIDERSLDRCFQLMETEDPSLFEEWIARWADLAEFEVVPVVGSAEAVRPDGRLGHARSRTSASKSPVSWASTTACTRSRSSSFWRMCVTCVLTVVSLM